MSAARLSLFIAADVSKDHTASGEISDYMVCYIYAVIYLKSVIEVVQTSKVCMLSYHFVDKPVA